jgi:hypothetical protein
LRAVVDPGENPPFILRFGGLTSFQTYGSVTLSSSWPADIPLIVERSGFYVFEYERGGILGNNCCADPNGVLTVAVPPGAPTPTPLPSPTPTPGPGETPMPTPVISIEPKFTQGVTYVDGWVAASDGACYVAPFIVRNTGGADLLIYDNQQRIAPDFLRLTLEPDLAGTVIGPGESRRVRLRVQADPAKLAPYVGRWQQLSFHFASNSFQSTSDATVAVGHTAGVRVRLFVYAVPPWTCPDGNGDGVVDAADMLRCEDAALGLLLNAPLPERVRAEGEPLAPAPTPTPRPQPVPTPTPAPAPRR